MSQRRRRFALAFLASIFCSVMITSFGSFGFNAAQALPSAAANRPIPSRSIPSRSTPSSSMTNNSSTLSSYWAGHWAEPCVQSLISQGALAPSQLNRRYPDSPFTQSEYANLVLKAFPGAFAAANQYLGLTFDDARNEAEALLIAALGDDSQIEQPLGRAQALAILTSGSATPYQADATRTLSATFRDALLIPRTAREGVAAALAAGYIVDEPGTDKVGSARQLRPRRNTTLADGSAFVCRASLDARTVASVPASQVVAFNSIAAIAAPTRELRGVWMTNIDSDVLFSRAKLEPALNRLADLNFNTIYPTVWNWGYTLYPSAVAERTTGFNQGLYPDLDQIGRQTRLEAAQGDRDMLKELIEIAHSRNLKVIPWFEFGFMAPDDSALAARHPDWLTQKSDGTLTTAEGDHQRVWLNPFHPEVQRFIKALVAELSANYNIDGLQVDDHMGLPVAYGYDPYTVALYQKEHQGKLPPADEKDAEWTRWRADKITGFMGEVFRTLKSQRSQAVMSVSPNPQSFAYEYYLQDWDSWLKKGYVEELIIQLYRNDLGRFVWEMGQDATLFAKSHIPTSIGILSGLRGRSVPMSQITEQVEAVRDRNFSGVAFFFYETLWNMSTEGTMAERQAALQRIFPNQATYPQGSP